MRDKESLKIMLTGGGSGGHLFPLVAVSRAIRKIREDNKLPVEFYFVGPDTFAEQILQNEKITIYSIVSL